MSESVAPAAQKPDRGAAIDPVTEWLARHMLALLVGLMLIITLLPFAAPLFMHWGWERPAQVLYWFFGFTCHQLPQRSWFLFGPKLTYTQAEIQAVWPADNALVLRQFVGTPAMGWKVAWSDRMLSFYTGTALWGAVYWGLRRMGVRVRPLPWVWLGLALLPLIMDGLTHALNDTLAGVSGTGFRDTNAWLAALTGQAWPAFYAGDQAGTFNWWMRLVTGLLAAWGLAFAFFPRLEQVMQDATGKSHLAGGTDARALEDL